MSEGITEQQLIDAQIDVQDLAEFVNGPISPGLVTTRLLKVFKTLSRILSEIDTSATNAIIALGYAVPVTYAGGLSITLATQTVEFAGDIYAPFPSALPNDPTPGTFDPLQWHLVTGKTKTVDHADLITASGAGDGEIVITLGRRAAKDDGAGVYVYDFASVETADGGFVLNGPTGQGRFHLLDTTVANVLQFGAVPGTDCSVEFQAAIDSGAPVWIPKASTFYMIQDVELKSHVTIQAAIGSEGAEIRGVSSTLSSLFVVPTESIFGLTIEGGFWQEGNILFESTSSFTVSDSRFSHMNYEEFDSAIFKMDKCVSNIFEWCDGRRNQGICNWWTGVGQSNNNHFDNCTWQTNTGRYIQFDAGSQGTANEWSHLHLEDNETVIIPIYIDSAARVWSFHHGYFEESGSDYIWFFSDVNGTGRSNVIEQNHFAAQNFVKAIVKLSGSVHLQVKDNNFASLVAIKGGLPANADATTGVRLVELNGGNMTVHLLRNAMLRLAGNDTDPPLDYDWFACLDRITGTAAVVFEPESVDANITNFEVTYNSAMDLPAVFDTWKVTVTGNGVFTLVDHENGSTGHLIMKQDGTGGRVPTFANAVVYGTPSNTSPNATHIAELLQTEGTTRVFWMT